jgi:hypothetical protein
MPEGRGSPPLDGGMISTFPWRMLLLRDVLVLLKGVEKGEKSSDVLFCLPSNLDSVSSRPTCGKIRPPKLLSDIYSRSAGEMNYGCFLVP